MLLSTSSKPQRLEDASSIKDYRRSTNRIKIELIVTGLIDSSWFTRHHAQAQMTITAKTDQTAGTTSAPGWPVPVVPAQFAAFYYMEVVLNFEYVTKPLI